MSYEGQMLEKFRMPSRDQVKRALLETLIKHGGAIKEFGAGQDIVDELADEFKLNVNQREAYLETIYRKENRVKRSPLWHRLLFRAANSLAEDKLVTRPTQTILLTNQKEWMLTEKGYEKALKVSNIPQEKKEELPIKTHETQKIVKKLNEAKRPGNYNPFDVSRKATISKRESIIRLRGFRQAVIQAYGFMCSICRLKINSPDSLTWEVEASHIVPHSSRGRDDIWNGIALCHLHHWAFDVGWFTITDEYTVRTSSHIDKLPSDYGRMGDYEFIRTLMNNTNRLHLPERTEVYPHLNSLNWHRENVFHP